ncbi:MAG TPA: ATP-binding protein [Opitutaceae bacterium]|nr:ATP-binding protein [Opitutaceae bacterium]
MKPLSFGLPDALRAEGVHAAQHNPKPVHPVMRILHLPTGEDDSRDVRDAVATDFPLAQVVTVACRDTFLTELRSGRSHAVISDYAPSALGVWEAVVLARHMIPTVPIVFYSRTTETRHAELMRQAGFQHCLTHGESGRLGGALRASFLSSHPDRASPADYAELIRQNRELHLRLDTAAERVRRLENIEVFASGLAHDLNNMFAPMMMAAPLLRDAVPESEARRMLDTLESSVQRGAAIATQILHLTLGGEGEAHLVRADELVREAARRLADVPPREIVTDMVLPVSTPQVRVVPRQIQQALLNLFMNARAAMRGGGHLRIGLETRLLDETAAQQIPAGRPGSFAMIYVHDTGAGISAERMPHLWEGPGPGQSTPLAAPLGLPVVRSIVKRHRGFVQLLTTPGRGTTVRIFLPTVPTP